VISRGQTKELRHLQSSFSRFPGLAAGQLGNMIVALDLIFYPTLNGPLAVKAWPIFLVYWMSLSFRAGLVQLLLQTQELSKLIHTLRSGSLCI
jgi:hypothetical protein